MAVPRVVLYEEELDPTFAAEVAAQPGGERLWDCLQCGTCSATCPVSLYMDRTPRQIIGMVRAGFREQVLNSLSPWICTSCYSCTVECPAGIRITDIMYTVKRLAMKEGSNRHFVVPAIEDAFVRMVSRNGRLSEGRMGMRVALRSGVRSAAATLPLAWKLRRRGRLRLLAAERMRDPGALVRVLGAMRPKPAAKAPKAEAAA
jgi:heterodisulfide reductase subunit C